MGTGSFEAFVADRSPALLGTAYLLTNDRVRARDLLQTALIATRRHWDAMADADEATAFARRELVAEHTSWRRLLRIGDLLVDSPLMGSAAGFPGFARQPADPGPQDELSAALAGLTPQLRATLVLRYGEGLTEAATAEVLGRPAPAVGTDAARGLDLLGTDGPRLGRYLRQRAQQLTAAPGDVLDTARDGARAQRNHRLALLVLVALLAAIVVLVWLTLPDR